jgi:hypothetical protein
MPITNLVNDCTHGGWRDRAGAAVADWPTLRKIRHRSGAGRAAPKIVIPSRANLVNDPEYPSDAVIREVARKLAELFCGE